MLEVLNFINEANGLIWNLIGILFGIVILKIAFGVFVEAFKEH